LREAPEKSGLRAVVSSGAKGRPARRTYLYQSNMSEQESGAGQTSHGTQPMGNKALIGLCLGALGVVFGDIGTSPLYTMSEIFFGHGGVSNTPEHIIGATSIILWGLILVVTMKYVAFVLRADHDGEGGGFALLALLSGQNTGAVRAIGYALVLAAGLLYGEGVITPAISVLSAVEGLKFVTNTFEPYILPITCGIIIALFWVQKRGTHAVGVWFGPVVLLWFLSLAALGLSGIIRDPRILSAFNPLNALWFLYDCGIHGSLMALGTVVLAVTGCEALFADMGHFGRRAIQIAWLAVPFPALMLIYLGQGAWLYSGSPVEGNNLFFSMVPSWGLIPMVILATAATVIASQSLISGAFSVTRQAIALGLFPRLRIEHTNDEHMGQVYIPAVNWALAVGCLLLVVTFRSSSALAAAYGFAVCGVMAVTSLGMWALARYRWGWSTARATLIFGSFFLVDSILLVATSLKFMDGGWVPLVLGSIVFMVMLTWKWGRAEVAAGLEEQVEPETVAEMLARRKAGDWVQSKRSIVVMSSRPIDSLDDHVPAVLKMFHQRFGITPRHIIFVTVIQEKRPVVSWRERVEFVEFCRDEVLGSVVALRLHYGYMEVPSVRKALATAKDKNKLRLPGSAKRWLVLVGQDHLHYKGKSLLVLLRLKLFGFMLRNSVPAHQYLGLGDDSGVISEVLHVNLWGGSKVTPAETRTAAHPTRA
jgi:KUP system potassium uptake protein